MYIWGDTLCISCVKQRVIHHTHCLKLRHHLRLDALPEARRRHVIVLLLVRTAANQALTNKLQQHLHLDALLKARRQHVPVETANQTLTNELRYHLVGIDALPEARRRHVLLVLVTTVNQRLTDQGRRRRTTTSDSTQRCQQQVARNLQILRR
jgi:hypothetical protein